MRSKMLILVIGVTFFIFLDMLFGKIMIQSEISKEPQKFLKMLILMTLIYGGVQWRIKEMTIGSIKFWILIEFIGFLVYKIFKLS